MPARPAAAPRAVPARQLGRRGLPQHEVGGMLLVRRDLDARAGDHAVEAAAGQCAVVVHARDVEQHVALGLVSVAAGEQGLDHGHHLRDVVGRARLDVGRQRPERRHVVVERLGEALGQRRDRLAAFLGGGDDLVVDVGDVADIGDVLVAIEEPQQPVEHVEHDHRPRVADVRAGVDGGPAHVHADVLGVEGLEQLLGARLGIVEAKGHGRLGEDWAQAVSPRDRARARARPVRGNRFRGPGPRSRAPDRVSVRNPTEPTSCTSAF